MNYSELTDFQINKLVAEAIHKDKSFDHCFYGESIDNPHAIFLGDIGEFKIADYCNNPEDAWPIILENKISIQHNVLTRSADWFAGVYCFDGEPIETDYMDNPLRAAMIVYLMMGDE